MLNDQEMCIKCYLKEHGCKNKWDFSVVCFFLFKKKYLRGDEKEKTGEKYLEKIEYEKRE